MEGLLLLLLAACSTSQMLQGSFVPRYIFSFLSNHFELRLVVLVFRSHGRMKTTTPMPYTSFLHTSPATTGSTEVTSLPASVKDAEAKKDMEEEKEDEVYILYGVLFNNGSEPVIASNITDSEVVEEVRSRLVTIARDHDKNFQEEDATKEKERVDEKGKSKKKFGNGLRSGNGVGEIIVGKRRKEELIMSRVDHSNKPSKAPTYYPVKLEDSSKPKVKLAPPVTQPLKLGNSPTKTPGKSGMPVKQPVKLGSLVKQLLKYPVKPRTNQAVELPPLTEQLFNLSRSDDHRRNDEGQPSTIRNKIKEKKKKTPIQKFTEKDENKYGKVFHKQKEMDGSKVGNNLQENHNLVATNNAVHSFNSFGHEKWVHEEETPLGRGSNNPEFAEKITKAIFPPNLTPAGVPTRGSLIEGMSGPKLNHVRSNQKMDSGENAKSDESVLKKGFQDKSDHDSDVILVYPVSEKPVYFRPKVSASKFVEIQPVYIGPHGAAVHGKYQFEEADARGTTTDPPTTKPQDSFDKPFLETDTWEVSPSSFQQSHL